MQLNMDLHEVTQTRADHDQQYKKKSATKGFCIATHVLNEEASE